MEQYRDAKEAFPDAILFFRLGDFYEMFNDDAVVASRELQLTLTSRNKNSEDQVPMAGVPIHAAHGYVAKLIARGHKVAICEQLGDPSKMKGIVPRKVVRVITPGLVTETGQLDAKQHNFLCAIECEPDGTRHGLALVDVSTGEMAACSTDTVALLVAEVARAEPVELLLPPGHDELCRAIALACPRTALRVDEPIDAEQVRRHLDERVATPLFRDATREHAREAVVASARVLRFASRHLPDSVLPVVRIAPHDPNACMRIDETAQQHLELVRGTDGSRHGSLLEAIDATVTAGGGRLLRRQLLAPLCEVTAIRRRLDAVELMVLHARARRELRAALERIGDIERLAVRASFGESTPRDLAALCASLEAVPEALAALASLPRMPGDASEPADALLTTAIDPQTELCALLSRAIADDPPVRASDGGVIREGYDSELDELRSLRSSGGDRLAELEARLKTELDIGSLKVKYTRGFGWYIEITKAHLAKAPREWRRKQTLVNGERYTSDELDELADRVMGAEERYAEREAVLFSELIARVAERGHALRALAAVVAQWDVSSALAEIAHRHDYRRPIIDDGARLALDQARHPVVERFVAAGKFVPNDTVLDLQGERMVLVTGPNMAGKSTLMRQVALNTILAQMGSFVPAREAHIGVIDRVLSRVGASDNLARGESTFMVEMRETATILRDATHRSLVILDEIGRGTSTFDGLAIAWAVAEHLLERVRCRVMFATHYHELTALADQVAGLANYSVSAREHDGDIVFLHRLTKGAVNKSYGIAVAKLAGLPDAVVARARAILASLEGGEPAPRGPKGRHAASDRQLDLFQAPAAVESIAPAEREALDSLRAVDPNRMTPLEALQLLVDLKRKL
jgi:DNA mismatch repair protein MutS